MSNDADDSYDVATCTDCRYPAHRERPLRDWWRTNGWAGVREAAGIFLDLFPIPGRKRPEF